MNQPKYLLEVGAADQKRLEILAAMYHPFTLEFLRKNGLKKGMRVLEIGCGVGDMACLLAKTIGKNGHVTAIDISNEQLEIAREKAKKRGITNIEFKELSVENLSELNDQYDLVYEKWVLVFLKNPKTALQEMLNRLKPSGILVCEDCSPGNTNVFSYPLSVVPEFFHSLMLNNFRKSGLDINFGDSLYQIFKNLNCKSIDVSFHQPILFTPEEKSVFRFGFLTSKKSIVESGIFTNEEIDTKIQEAEIFEHEVHFTAFIRNILICGRKPG